MRTLLFFLLASSFVAPATAQQAPPRARVTYLTSNTVYVDAGSALGVRAGDRMRVVRDGEVIAELEVREVSSRRAACAILSQEGPLEVGDFVDLAAIAGEPRTGLDMASPAEPVRTAPPLGIRGRLGLQWLGIFDRSDAGRDLRRPALDLRLRGENVRGTRFGLQADVRARRTTVTGEGDDLVRNRNRVYRLNGSWRTGSTRVVLGRQVSQSLTVVSLFDGASLEWGRESWGVGAIAGVLPDPVALDLSTDVQEYGVYFRGGTRSAHLTGGLLASYDEGEIDREFAYLQARWSSREWSLYGAQEIDLNRSWKSDAGEDAVSPTSTHLVARWRPLEDWSFDAGLDTRRRVRRIRDRETPETEFDDTYRQGIWGGVRSTFARDYTVGLRAQTRRGVDDRSADSFTLELSARPRVLRDWSFGSRTTFYRNDFLDGWLQTLRARWTVNPSWELGAFGGLRNESGQDFDAMDGTDGWVGADLDIALGRQWWMAVSVESNLGGEEEYDQVWTGLGYRF